MAKLVLVLCMLTEILSVIAMAGESHEGSEVKVGTVVQPHGMVVSVADRPGSDSGEPITEGERETKVAEAPQSRRLGKHHSDMSVAGGGVIVGGLVTAIFAAVFCYIRVTRKKDGAR